MQRTINLTRVARLMKDNGVRSTFDGLGNGEYSLLVEDGRLIVGPARVVWDESNRAEMFGSIPGLVYGIIGTEFQRRIPISGNEITTAEILIACWKGINHGN